MRSTKWLRSQLGPPGGHGTTTRPSEHSCWPCCPNNTDWSKIERIQDDLAELFSGFSLKSYAELPACEVGDRILPWFLGRKAGSITLERDLVNLIGTARLLFEHSCVHGTAESYFTSLVRRVDGDPKQAALRLGSPGTDKLPAFGVALAAEALKNLGFDVAKPDRHVKRAVASFGLVPSGDLSNRNGRAAPSFSSKASQLAVMKAVQDVATTAGKPVVMVDNAIWLLCAKSGLHLTNPELAELAREGWSPDGSGRDRRSADPLVVGGAGWRGATGNDRLPCQRLGQGTPICAQALTRGVQGPELVSRTILLDSGPLGLITNPRASPLAASCGHWVVGAIRGGAKDVPEARTFVD